MSVFRRASAIFAAGLACFASFMPVRVDAQPAMSPGCSFVNSYSFPINWTNVLGGSFSPSQQFFAGETINVQITWTGGSAATGATFHFYASGQVINQSVAASGSLNSSYVLSSNSSYIDIGLTFAPTNVGRGNINLTATCQAAGAPKNTTNTDSARLTALVRNMAPMIANMSAQATTDMVIGNIDAVLAGSDNPQASDRGFRVSSFGALSYAEQNRSSAKGATGALDAAAGGKAGSARIDPPQWNVWVAGRYTAASGVWPNIGSSRGENVVGGVDRRIGGVALVGLFAGYEDFRFSNGFDSRIHGYGPSVGPYAGIRIADYLTLDAMAAYTDVRYRASAGFAAGTLRADRLTFAAALTARLRFDDVQFEPRAKLQYLTERQGAYTDTLGVFQFGNSFSAGRASLGTKVAYLGLRSTTLPLTPWVGVYGDLSFGEQTRVWSPTMAVLGNGLSARTAAGLDATVGTAVLSLSGEYGGIGAAYHTVSGRASLRIGF